LTTRSDGSFRTSSTAETEALGADLGSILAAGTVVLLSGELGAGKTTFIRGMARGLGVDDPGSVCSPSYTLVNRYPGPVALTHLDAYFMRSGEDLDLCGLEEARLAGDVVVVEWGDRVRNLFPEEAVEVVLQHTGEDERQILVRNHPRPPVAGPP